MIPKSAKYVGTFALGLQASFKIHIEWKIRVMLKDLGLNEWESRYWMQSKVSVGCAQF